MHSPPTVYPPFALTGNAYWQIHADQVFDGKNLLPESLISVHDGVISAIESIAQNLSVTAPVWRVPGLICAGFFDTQVNGGAGKMFNNTPDAATLHHIGHALRQAGTTAWLPTFITDTPDKLAQAALAIEAVYGQSGVVGVHFEGPHINLARKGAHLAAAITPFSEQTLAICARLRTRGIPVLMTLAPETLALKTISDLDALRVRVSIGHTAANSAQVQDALAAGACSFTHLFNAMTPMSSRDPGVVGTALDSNAWCGLIADGFHVSDPMIRIAVRARAVADRMVLVSDAMATTHGPDSFELYGETISVLGGRLVNQAGSLAGAHIDLARSVERSITQVGLEPQQVLRMATHNPAQMMNLGTSLPQIQLGQRVPQWVVLDKNWRLLSVTESDFVPD